MGQRDHFRACADHTGKQATHRSLTAGGGRHGMAISRGPVVQNDAESGEVGAGPDYLSSLLLPPRGLGMRGWSRIE